MILQSKDGRRRFEVYEQNWHFLMGLLAHDMKEDTTLLLTKDSTFLDRYECDEISDNIKSALTENIVYEVWDGKKIEPLFNPTTKILTDLKKMAQPITEKRKEFLLKLAGFLKDNNKLEISFE